MNKEIHFIHQCSVADDDDDDADAARNEASQGVGASLLAWRSSADRMRNLFASTQKWQIVHHEVNRACTRIRDCWAVVPATRGWLASVLRLVVTFGMTLFIVAHCVSDSLYIGLTMPKQYVLPACLSPELVLLGLSGLFSILSVTEHRRVAAGGGGEGSCGKSPRMERIKCEMGLLNAPPASQTTNGDQ